jgi:hypothetical protein
MGLETDENLLARLVAGELAPDAAEVLALFARRPEMQTQYQSLTAVEQRLAQVAALDRTARAAAALEAPRLGEPLRQPAEAGPLGERFQSSRGLAAAQGLDADLLAGIARAEAQPRESAGDSQAGGAAGQRPGALLSGSFGKAGVPHGSAEQAQVVRGRGQPRWSQLAAALVLFASGGLAVLAWQQGWFGGRDPMDPGTKLSGNTVQTIESRVPAVFGGRYTAFEWQCNAPTVASYDLTFLAPTEGGASTALGAPWVLLEPRFEPDAAFEASLPDQVEFEIVARDAQRRKLASFQGSTRRMP